MTIGPPTAPYWRIAACGRARRDARRLRARQSLCEAATDSRAKNKRYCSVLACFSVVRRGASKPGRSHAHFAPPVTELQPPCYGTVLRRPSDISNGRSSGWHLKNLQFARRFNRRFGCVLDERSETRGQRPRYAQRPVFGPQVSPDPEQPVT